MKTQLFVFIAGGSGSGKSTFASELKKTLQESNQKVSSIALDNFFIEVPDNMKVMDFRLKTDFCDLSSLDHKFLTQVLMQLSQGKKCQTPIYDFIASKRSKFVNIEPCEILIIEGLNAVNYANQLLCLDPKYTFNVFVNTDSYLSMVKQRSLRDQKERGLNAKEIKHQEVSLRNGFFKHIYKQQLADQMVVNVTNTSCNEPPGPTHPLSVAAKEISSLIIEKLGNLKNNKSIYTKDLRASL